MFVSTGPRTNAPSTAGQSRRRPSRPLEGHREYDTSYLCHRLVNREGYISYRGCCYSVPPEHAGRTLMATEDTEGRLRGYSAGRRGAGRLLAEKAGRAITSPARPEAGA